MTKVRVQDATKELSTNAGKMLENVTRLRKQSQDVLNSLRKVSDGFVREEKERQEREAKEELRKQYEASAQFMTAYSSEHVPEVPTSETVAKAAVLFFISRLSQIVYNFLTDFKKNLSY